MTETELLYTLASIIIGGSIGFLLARIKTVEHRTKHEMAQANIISLQNEITKKSADIARLASLRDELVTTVASLHGTEKTVMEKEAEINGLKSELKEAHAQHSETQKSLATAEAHRQSLTEKLGTQKEDIEALGLKFHKEFENLANEILENKTKKFTELNKNQLTEILDPLSNKLAEFKAKVEDVYINEAKERFSLGEKVKELAELNQQISAEAQNLTRALKGEAKTQGNWGEMILENILERSGLTEGREYLLQHQLQDTQGNALRSESEGKKMMPDAVICYPGHRQVIVDSKVSLNAYVRMMEAMDVEIQKQEQAAHVSAIKTHIQTLSTKAYDDYNKSLDFVMMFIPSEAAYNVALQGDPNLWDFAYEKRVLLLSPTNLITSLKLIKELWKREYQAQNVQAIADQGAKLYDKFAGFLATFLDVGKQLDRTQSKYQEAYKLFSEGKGNLLTQATKLKELGIKNKKELPPELITEEAPKETPV